VFEITFDSGKQLFPGLTATGIHSVRGALPVEIIDRLHDYTLNFRSSRAPGALRRNVSSSRIPGALSGLRPRERKEGVSLRERGRRKETERERERYEELDRESVKERREIGDR
jgi:hypothetical protein